MRVLGKGLKIILSLLNISSNFSSNLYYSTISVNYECIMQLLNKGFDFVAQTAAKEEIQVNEERLTKKPNF